MPTAVITASYWLGSAAVLIFMCTLLVTRHHANITLILVITALTTVALAFNMLDP